jgi:nickel-dependent lactate racemase
LDAHAIADNGHSLSHETVRRTLEQGLGGKFKNARVLVLIPDHTRTIPLNTLFPLVVELLSEARQLDFMVALGTHPPLNEQALCHLVGITPDQRHNQYSHIGLLNHEWDNPQALAHIGVLPSDLIQEVAGPYWHPSLAGDVPVRINRLALEYDHVVILGPTFPHEVVGFSGGAKYLFPGISGAEMINMTHWLGALITILDTIGIEQTPVRDLIHAAAALVRTPITLVGLVVAEQNTLAGIFVGSYLEAFHAAAQLSAQRHIVWVDEPYRRVLSCAPPMYDELWTGGKAMYKLEPAIADGGEVVIYAPHLDTVSRAHGKYLYQIGYHVRDYFLKQWEAFKDIPSAVVAHSTHVKGSGTFEQGRESPRIQVTLASKISPEDCQRLNLGYLDPANIHPDDWQNREDEGVLLVPKAGEILYRVRENEVR